MSETGVTNLTTLAERAVLLLEEVDDACGTRLYSDGRQFWVACLETSEVEAHTTTVDAAAAAMAGSLSAYRHVLGDDGKPLYPELVKAAKRWEKPNRADLVTDALTDHDLPDYAVTEEEVEKKEKERGPRWFVSAVISPGRYRYAYADTEHEAWQVIAKYRKDGLTELDLAAPVTTDHLEAEMENARRRWEAHQAEGERISQAHRELARRAASPEYEYAETEISERMGRTRKTVRAWLGKDTKKAGSR